MNKIYIRVLIVFLIALAFWGCRSSKNFTTYFNTYYNMERLLKESEEEFAYQEEKVRVNPRVITPETGLYRFEDNTSGPPPFMRNLVVPKKSRQPVEVKLDSIIIKGSKVLARHAKSDYVMGTLYLMATAYFYKEEWLPAQIKCSELIDKYPEGKLSPDAHLLLAQTLIMQRKFPSGKTMLSRTVDIAWQLKRYDILSEAFRTEAELALFERDMDGSLKPYRQAIAQSDNDEMSARWQVDLGSMLYRMGKFDKAEKEFAKVFKYDPDYLTNYEAKLYRAASLSMLGRIEESEEILNKLYKDGKFEEWKGFTYAQMTTNHRLSKATSKELIEYERLADSMYPNNAGMSAYYFMKALEMYDSNDYAEAGKCFGRARNHVLPLYQTAYDMYSLLSDWGIKRSKVLPVLRDLDEKKELTDSAKSEASLHSFELGRIHERLKNPDSSLFYYNLSMNLCPAYNPEAARYIHAYARLIREKDPYTADSLLEVIAVNYPRTDYGLDAMKQLGFTDAFMIDSVAELFASGSNLRKYGDYSFAITQFLKIYNQYPDNKYAPKALYAIGWIYEYDIRKIDSAIFYYKLLLEKYPASIYAEDIRLSLIYLAALNSGEPIPDSLKSRIRETYVPKQSPGRVVTDPNVVVDPNLPPDLQRFPDALKQQGKDLFQQGKDFFNKGKNMLKNPKDLIKEINPMGGPKPSDVDISPAPVKGNVNPPPPPPLPEPEEEEKEGGG